MPDCDPDTTSDDKDAPTSDEGSPSSSSSDDRYLADECRHLAHLEAIPIRHGGHLRLIRRARVSLSQGTWYVTTWNNGGPDIDICYRVPGSKNNWIARFSRVGSSEKMSELLSLVASYFTEEQKSYDQKHYINHEEVEGEDATSIIIESFKGTSEGQVTLVMTGPEEIPALQARLGFRIWDQMERND
ncbi:hypothetical protein FPOA_07966 [Fusarium poae]|uniref:Uncharacterized protein n=1 Tax=Fusarium poae TaxID=36050 RepID=A0A1B8AM34_FUSPO|nr:hypothetical protein FPOA_07966 [Fusarium poae]